MQQVGTMRYCYAAFFIVLLCGALVSAAPAYNDYEIKHVERTTQNKISPDLHVGELYELLMQKEAMDEQLNHPHQIVRKSNRLPTLRLRFGKRMDPYFQNSPFASHPLRLYEELSEN